MTTYEIISGIIYLYQKEYPQKLQEAINDIVSKKEVLKEYICYYDLINGVDNVIDEKLIDNTRNVVNTIKKDKLSEELNDLIDKYNSQKLQKIAGIVKKSILFEYANKLIKYFYGDSVLTNKKYNELKQKLITEYNDIKKNNEVLDDISSMRKLVNKNVIKLFEKRYLQFMDNKEKQLLNEYINNNKVNLQTYYNDINQRLKKIDINTLKNKNVDDVIIIKLNEIKNNIDYLYKRETEKENKMLLLMRVNRLCNYVENLNKI